MECIFEVYHDDSLLTPNPAVSLWYVESFFFQVRIGHVLKRRHRTGPDEPREDQEERNSYEPRGELAVKSYLVPRGCLLLDLAAKATLRDILCPLRVPAHLQGPITTQVLEVARAVVSIGTGMGQSVVPILLEIVFVRVEKKENNVKRKRDDACCLEVPLEKGKKKGDRECDSYEGEYESPLRP
ncbi:hypothetical protein Acr_26g0008040 [Actinidia rufa]|uniref:Uncharacterized protein n=1 Tax=Actinidia rufa TaxID=165716 RepID=A0A7J0H455_9ERIC|nr:hypothetical protein Acr_26g0008040 [Actinidia rufa]